MNESNLKAAAFALAEATPKWLDQPTTPPIHWRLEGNVLRVLLADGRTVRGPAPVLARGSPIKVEAVQEPPKESPSIPAKAEDKKPLPSTPAPSHHRNIPAGDKKVAGKK